MQLIDDYLVNKEPSGLDCTLSLITDIAGLMIAYGIEGTEKKIRILD